MKQADEAISEAIGAILILSLTIIGLSIVMTAVISQVQVTRLPSVELVAIDQDYGSFHTLNIVHNGGDDLPQDQIEIRVNGSNVTCQGSWSSNQDLKTGGNLSFSPLHSVDNLSIIYHGSGSGGSLVYYTEKFVKVKGQ